MTNVEAEFVKASDVTGRFDTGHTQPQVNFTLFPPENIKMIRGIIVAEERSYSIPEVRSQICSIDYE